jgi:cystathionine gamma-synthase
MSNEESKSSKAARGDSTLSVHGGEEQLRVSRSITPPVVLASTYPFGDTAELISYMQGEVERPAEYGRYGNPTVSAVEAKLAALEGGDAACLMSSGMAVITTTLLAMLRSGAHVIFTADVYRKTRTFARGMLTRYGVEVDVVEPTVEAVAAAIRPETKVIFTELPTNPYLRVLDLEALCSLAKSKRIKTIVDSTFATPLNLRPLEHGADLVVHSATKYFGGHNDLLGGVVIGKRGLVGAIREALGTLGAVPDPHGAYLLFRGLKTLALRVGQHNRSALQIARALESRPEVAQVWYPMLESHPDHVNAKRFLKGGGAVISFELHGGLAAGTVVCDGVTIPKIAPSLGGVESLIEQPAYMSFFDHSPDQRAAIGIREGLVRMSVGIEDVDDLQADLFQALDRLG